MDWHRWQIVTGALAAWLGVAAIGVSFIDAYQRVQVHGVGTPIDGMSAGDSAWNGATQPRIAMALVVVAVALVLARLLAGTRARRRVRAAGALAAVGLACAGGLLHLLHVYSGHYGEQVDVGPGWSAWILLALIASMTVVMAADLSLTARRFNRPDPSHPEPEPDKGIGSKGLIDSSNAQLR